SLSSDKKLRVHFHKLMQIIHESLEKLEDSKNSIATIAKNFAKQYWLICMDEIFVADITDAMLLAELFKHLIENGVVLLFTSNIAPQDLYKGGLQRARFLPAIDLIEKNCHVIELGGHKDYRLETLEHNRLYQLTSASHCNEHLEDLFQMMSGVLQSQYDKKELQINHRQLPIKKYTPGLAWFDFDILCNTYRNSSDYIHLATYFTTIIISDIYRLSADQDDVARRFINLIDVMYDRHINIVISAESSPEELYTGSRLKNEFKRTISRLKEMQTIDYLSKNKEYKEILDKKMSDIDMNFVETSLNINNPTRFGDWVSNNGRCSDF
ncbi:MAG: cell division protein ZapE, partial [Gammaproteobacteria bacterium]|nr:cell division protein ZapE [Gammaproteobacteria bacterium]